MVVDSVQLIGMPLSEDFAVTLTSKCNQLFFCPKLHISCKFGEIPTRGL